MGLELLWKLARPIPKQLELTNKYTWLGVNNLLPARYLDVNDTITQPDMPIRNYLIKNEAVLLFPNFINGVLVSMFIKPLYSKAAPLQLGSTLFPYNIGNLNPNFKYGDPIILVEGIADLAALKLMDESLNVISMQGSKLHNAQIEFLSYISNNLIAFPDNDWAGSTGFTQMWYRFKDFKVNVVSVDQFRYYKDTGDFLDRIVYYYKTEDNDILDEIQIAWNFYQVAIETEKKNMR